MKRSDGLPIAAYLGLLVALALASAFVAVLAIVIWLPPRPPDVMRADTIADQFCAGFQHTIEANAPPYGDGMAWSVSASPPAISDAPHLKDARKQLARQLGIGLDDVRVFANHVARNDVFVFRVRDMEEGRRRELEFNGSQVVIDAPTPNVPEVRRFELRIPRHERNAERVPEVAPVAPVAPTAATAPVPPEPPAPPHFAPAPPGVLLLSGFEVAAKLPNGRWLVMRQGRNWAELGWITRAALIIGATLTVLSLLAVLFARRLTRPIRNFSGAVQAVGVDPQSEPVREEGPRELRGAARAVNTMQARLRALVADRTKTLAAVAHDMRTPLMRLRLLAENVPVTERERMAKEIGEVEALVASFIAFARDDPAEEARVRIDVSALLQSIADDHAEAGRDVVFSGAERVVITGQSLGLKRLFGNLVDNALKYGQSARIDLRHEGGAIIVDVVDDGPGVPAGERDSVFEPFVRLDESDNGRGGAGLGLPTARSIARAHGGDIVILESERGAHLRVTLPG